MRIRENKKRESLVIGSVFEYLVLSNPINEINEYNDYCNSIMKLTYNSRTGPEIGNKLLKDGPGPKMPEIFFDAKLSSGKFRLEVPAL